MDPSQLAQLQQGAGAPPPQPQPNPAAGMQILGAPGGAPPGAQPPPQGNPSASLLKSPIVQGLLTFLAGAGTNEISHSIERVAKLMQPKTGAGKDAKGAPTQAPPPAVA